ncbi:hypothetical protein BG011_007156 [Mortierella polycephala]|uniref:CRAL-TRIO domain-containing protein n=1 Tax=Mortierella polycephala TaxID=41804 RepID=A0A9P6QBP3_9FUNG|nr:hypothetical protein BG011_007156 [Mortierella polycephala]
MKHQPDSTGHVGNLTPEQWDALGEIWSFLLHLWYSEPSSPTKSSHLRRASSFGIPSFSTTTASETNNELDAATPAGQSPPTMSPSSPGTAETQHIHQQSHQSQRGHRQFGSSSSTNEKRAISPPPASPTRLDQSFRHPSITSASGPTSPINPSVSSLPGGAAAAAAALRRSAAKLKPWLPSKKFTFKYSPTEYQTAFWSFVQSEHPDTTVLRFLRARKWNVEKAMEMLVLALEWRITMGVDEVVEEGEEALDAKYPGFLEQLKNGKVIFRGHDRHGRPLCLLNPSLHNPNAQSHQAVQKLSIYVIETARMMLRPPVETISVLFDMSSFSMSNMDWPTVKFFIHAAEACYPELLGVCVVHKAPWLFGAVWKLISPMLDPVIRAKIQFTNNRKDLEEFVAPDQLMNTKAYEGEDATPYHYVPPVPGENRLLHEDSDAKLRAMARRKEMELTFERLTEVWQGQKQLSSSAAVIQERHEVGMRMADVLARV